MYFIKRNSKVKLISSFIRLYSEGRKSHYDVLNLQRNCSDKDIKDAYIQMSKEYHPDKNKDAKAQERFVRIVEAYNVLSKPGSRAQYDAMTSSPHGASYVYRTHVPYNLRKNPDYSYYWNHTPPKSDNTKSDSYYGVKGVKKLPNYIIILICFSVAAIGCIIQLAVIQKSYSVHRRKNIERSMMLAEELEQVRAAARGKTNEMQTRMLMDKIVTAANPSVATASLGQALADEKKKSSDSMLTDLDIYESDKEKIRLSEAIKNVISYFGGSSVFANLVICVSRLCQAEAGKSNTSCR